MSYTIRNIRPSVLHIPDTDVRLESGQAVVVETLSPQMGTLVDAKAIEVVSSDAPPQAPVVAVPLSEIPPPPVDMPTPKRGSKTSAAKPEETESLHDDQ